MTTSISLRIEFSEIRSLISKCSDNSLSESTALSIGKADVPLRIIFVLDQDIISHFSVNCNTQLKFFYFFKILKALDKKRYSGYNYFKQIKSFYDFTAKEFRPFDAVENSRKDTLTL